MKNIKVLFAFVAGFFFYFFLIHSMSCTREDAVVGTIEPPTYTYGNDTISMANPKWKFDKTHSNVMWETPYKGVGSLLTGRFNTFNTNVEFREDHPELSSLSGFVVLSSVNTSEPGRDGGCLLTTFGVTTTGDTASLVSKSIAFDGKGGYVVTADFTFHGVTKEVKMQLNYSGKTFFPSSTDPLQSYWVQGLTGQFEFNAISDYGLVTTNIADTVVVKMNILIRYYSNQ